MPDKPLIIDPPVSAYSTVENIEAWIKELKSIPDSEEVQTALTQANHFLTLRKNADQ